MIFPDHKVERFAARYHALEFALLNFYDNLLEKVGGHWKNCEPGTSQSALPWCWEHLTVGFLGPDAN